MPDDIISVGREQIAVRPTTAETGGRLLALDVTMPPGGGSPGLHRHAAAEAYRVLKGEFTLYLGLERIPAPAGSVFHVPGGRAHTIRNESDAPARDTVFRPSVLASSDLRSTLHNGDAEPMERFMRAAGTADDVMALAAEHGIELIQ